VGAALASGKVEVDPCYKRVPENVRKMRGKSWELAKKIKKKRGSVEREKTRVKWEAGKGKSFTKNMFRSPEVRSHQLQKRSVHFYGETDPRSKVGLTKGKLCTPPYGMNFSQKNSDM